MDGREDASPPPRLVVLGCGPAEPTLGRMASGYALLAPGGEVLQLDCGPGTTRRWPEHGLGFERLVGLLLTHHHLDHCGDLPYLRFLRRFLPGSARSVLCAGPVGHRALWNGLSAAFGEHVADPEGAWSVRDLADGARLAVGPFEVEARAVQHIPGALGYRVYVGGRGVAFSGDSARCEALVDLCREADLALLECSHPAGRPSERHLSATDVAQVAIEARVASLAVTHVGTGCHGVDVARQIREAGYTGPLRLVRDGDVLDV